jgi:hypothetical protein
MCAASSCDALLSANPMVTDGVYRIAPGGLPPQDTFCRFNPHMTASGGWTLLMRSYYEYTGQTERLWTNYADFYANSVGNAPPGGVFRLPGRYWSQFSASGGGRQEHLFVLTPRTTTNASCLPMFFKVDDGRWEFSPTGPGRITNVPGTGTRFFHRSPTGTFSTRSDDTSSNGCVTNAMRRGVPWSYAECAAFTPGFQLGSQFDSLPRPFLSDIETGTDLLGRTLIDACGSATPLRSTEGYEILSVLEYYSR